MNLQCLWQQVISSFALNHEEVVARRLLVSKKNPEDVSPSTLLRFCPVLPCSPLSPLPSPLLSSPLLSPLPLSPLLSCPALPCFCPVRACPMLLCPVCVMVYLFYLTYLCNCFPGRKSIPESECSNWWLQRETNQCEEWVRTVSCSVQEPS